MNKRFLFLLTLTFSLIVPTFVFAFSDTEGHWAAEAIERASRLGVVNGYEDDSFCPENAMTRAEIVTVIVKMLGLTTETDKYIPDITSQDWYYPYFKKAVYFGIIQGDEQGNVNPERYVTREEAMVILARAFQLKTEDSAFASSFADDAQIASWAKKEVLSFVKKEYIRGYEDGTLRPKNHVKRAEVVTILNRVIKNVMTYSSASTKLNGNTLIKDKNMILSRVEIYGDLIVGEVATNSLVLDSTTVTGNLILYAPMDLTQQQIAISGNVIKAYENKAVSNLYYINEPYGILFSIPDGASSYTENENTMIDYNKEDLIVVEMDQQEIYYTQSITDICKEHFKSLRSDSIFMRKSKGEVQSYPYEIYMDNAATKVIAIKRDNIVYWIWFYHVVSDNLLDSVLSNISFFAGEKVPNHERVIYQNTTLALKFHYKNGYVGVDDSYNTGIIYSGDSMFKLFIQVSLITDMDEYSLSEIKTVLKSLLTNDGKVQKEEIKKVSNHDAIQFEIESEEDRIISLYVLIGHNLYNFIFRGEATAMEAVGNEMFQSIVNSMEF